MRNIDPFELDRALARAAEAERKWQRRLRRDPALASDDAWFQPLRWVTTRATFDEVSSAPDGDLLREPRRRWVYRLLRSRIAQPLIVEACLAREAPYELEKPERVRTSARDVVRRALSDPEPERRALWLDALPASAERVRSAERTASQALSEVTARLGIASPATLVSPYPHDVLQAECRTLLASTRDLGQVLLGPAGDMAGLLGRLVCRDVRGSWPTQANARWLSDQFAGTPLLAGFSIDLGPLPPLLGATTFARALARFGAAWSRAAAPQAAPFPLAHDATEAEPLRKGALFAALLTDPAFLGRRLDFSRETARAVGRSLALAALAQVRLDAARTLFDLHAMPARDARDVLEDALCVRLDEGMVGVLPKFGGRAFVRLAGALLAVGDAHALRNNYDEDWFDNPRALADLRESAALPPALAVPAEALDGAAQRYTRWIEQLSTR